MDEFGPVLLLNQADVPTTPMTNSNGLPNGWMHGQIFMPGRPGKNLISGVVNTPIWKAGVDNPRKTIEEVKANKFDSRFRNPMETTIKQVLTDSISCCLF
jgi:hypothetical protein